MNNTDPTNKLGMKSGAHERKAVLASYKTSGVLLIHTIKSGKSRGSDRGKKTST
jgi:hypothetical protein